ncbi:Fms-interacting protein-domain-containing protein [Podospora appendiculata]|uniref:Fms-interacting protein-domain-containing protein n=1 Tax=Podospora appendiculata TaxID=314037 RepID=A0AAE1CGC9_9PEZI|nr:Fms-interacting protein-domain-containing protein [Podospora appendiculata]
MAVDTITDGSLAAVLEASKSAREQALAVIDHRIQVSAASGGGGTAPLSLDAQSTISKQLKLLNTNLAHLRGLHRAAHFRARETKSQTADARHEVDVLHLQLQNLYYEQRHLEGEILGCESFEHTYQTLPLIPVDEFLALHPEHAAIDDDDDNSALMIARIEHERAEREALEAQRLELQKRKQKLIADNKKRRDDLANLDKDLEKFIDAAKPIQKLFEKVV